MHKIPFNNPNNKQLSQFVLQASEMLSLYNAELARILHLQCNELGDTPFILIVDNNRLHDVIIHITKLANGEEK